MSCRTVCAASHRGVAPCECPRWLATAEKILPPQTAAGWATGSRATPAAGRLRKIGRVSTPPRLTPAMGGAMLSRRTHGVRERGDAVVHFRQRHADLVPASICVSVRTDKTKRALSTHWSYCVASVWAVYPSRGSATMASRALNVPFGRNANSPNCMADPNAHGLDRNGSMAWPSAPWVVGEPHG